MKSKKKLIIMGTAAGIILIITLSFFVIRSVSKAAEKKNVQQSINTYVEETSSLNAMNEASSELTKDSLLKDIYKDTSYEIKSTVSNSDVITAKVLVTAPDMKDVAKRAFEAFQVDFKSGTLKITDSEAAVSLIDKYMKEQYKKSIKKVSSEVQVTMKNTNNKLEIVRNRDWINATTGGLIEVYQEEILALEKSIKSN